MGLNKSKGNMYDWVTHTHTHIGGICPHNCTYCYVKSFASRTAKYQGSLRLIDKELEVGYGKDKTIFIDNCNDLFAKSVPMSCIEKVLEHCRKYPHNTYVFQTKNPARYLEIDKDLWPQSKILGCTIESNRHYPYISHAPDPQERCKAMSEISGPKFITIEPILDFDTTLFAEIMSYIKPDFINIGADSNGHNLPEPSREKILMLFNLIERCGLNIRKKHNLERFKI